MRNFDRQIPTPGKVLSCLLLVNAVLLLLSGCVVEAPAPRVRMEAAVRISIAPPALPIYVQPPCPEDGYLWTPGYWAYGADDYYWVPGTWVRPPRVGVLWTPGYWSWNSGIYIFHAGYWGEHVGFYGGVVYGGGYTGSGYAGGRWVNNHIAYNTSVTNVNQTIVHNTYNETVNVTINNNVTVNNTSFHGGPNGIHAAPTAQEQAAEREPHVQPTAQQMQHINDAQRNPALFSKVNQGRPAIAATPRPGAFNAPGAVPALHSQIPATSHVAQAAAKSSSPVVTPHPARAEAVPPKVTPPPPAPTFLKPPKNHPPKKTSPPLRDQKKPTPKNREHQHGNEER